MALVDQINSLATRVAQAVRGKAELVHSHSAADLTTGLINGQRLPKVLHGGVQSATMTGGQNLNWVASDPEYLTVMRLTLTTASTANTVNVPTGSPFDGQVMKIHAYASGGARALQFATGYRTSTGIARGPHTIPDGQVLIAAVEYSALANTWVITAVTVSAT